MPGLFAIGSARAIQGIDVSSQLGGIVSEIHIGSGQDVAKDAPLFDLDTSVERADLKSYMATLTNADISPAAPEDADDRRQHLEGQPRRRPVGARPGRRRRRADQGDDRAEDAGRALRRVGSASARSTWASIRHAGMSLITLQQLDPIYVDFPIPEQSLDLLKEGEPVEVKVDSRPGQVFRGTGAHHRRARRVREPQRAGAGDLQERRQEAAARHVRQRRGHRRTAARRRRRAAHGRQLLALWRQRLRADAQA